MKKLASEQKLLLILASTDCIYGTNYNFCHGVIGKDLTGMMNQKIIQSLGRIGRNHCQQEYTVRFRNDELIGRLLRGKGNPGEGNPGSSPLDPLLDGDDGGMEMDCEAVMMGKLFA